MAQQHKTHLILKTLLIGGLVATLIYLFHPDVGAFSLIINNEPIADPLVHFAAIPTLLIALLLMSVLMLLAFLGVGLFIFIAVLGFSMFGMFLIAPYVWPVLVIIFLIILFMSWTEPKDD